MRKAFFAGGEKKVRDQLIRVYLVTGFVPMFILFVFLLLQISRILTGREVSNLENIFTQATETLDMELKIRINMSEYVAYNQTIAEIVNRSDQSTYDTYQRLSREFDPTMDSLIYMYPDITDIVIYAGQDVIPHGNYLRPLYEAQDEAWAAEAKPQIQWYADVKEKKLYMTRTMPLLTGGEDSILYIALDYDSVFDVLKLELDHDYGIFVYDDEGQVLYGWAQKQDENSNSLDYATFCEERDGASDGYEIVTRQLENCGWTVGCYMEKREMLSPLWPVLLGVAGLWLLCAAASVLVVLHFADGISGRIRNLHDAVMKVEKGDLTAQVEEKGNDEIGDLDRGFNHMVVEMDRLIREVYESKIRQKNYEMTALRAQINPHFLYNSLSLINWKALERGADDISRVTLALSRYYRTSLNKGNNLMTLREELDNVRAYLEIQEVMHDSGFEVIFEVDDAVCGLESLNLILQPLVENAIIHGIDRRRQGGGKIRVSARREGDEVVLGVEDNGAGMPEETACRLTESGGGGYGVKNVQDRIRLEYGDDYGLTVKSREGEGTCVTIRYPAREFHRK